MLQLTKRFLSLLSFLQAHFFHLWLPLCLVAVSSEWTEMQKKHFNEIRFSIFPLAVFAEA